MGILNRIFYYGIIVPISLLPFPLLYLLSDFVYLVLYYLVGYRKKVVMENLKNSFPEKSQEERVKIAKRFYHHFCDLTLESLKMFTISKESAESRIEYLDTDITKKYFEQGKSLIVALGHYNNWELVAVTLQKAGPHHPYTIYKPLTNKYFDQKVIDSRTRFGLGVMAYNSVKEDFDKMKDELTATYFVIDQAPSFHSKPHWMTFLNQETGVLTGTEKYAKTYNFGVVYLHIEKPRRGHYTARYVDITDSPRSFPDYQITEMVTKALEQQIIEKPEFWLWSHRRWKRKRENSDQHFR